MEPMSSEGFLSNYCFLETRDRPTCGSLRFNMSRSRCLSHELASSAQTIGTLVEMPLGAPISVLVSSAFVLSCLATGWSPIQGICSSRLTLMGNRPRGPTRKEHDVMGDTTICCRQLSLCTVAGSWRFATPQQSRPVVCLVLQQWESHVANLTHASSPPCPHAMLCSRILPLVAFFLNSCLLFLLECGARACSPALPWLHLLLTDRAADCSRHGLLYRIVQEFRKHANALLFLQTLCLMLKKLNYLKVKVFVIFCRGN